MKNILTKGHFGPDFPLKAMDGFDVKEAFSAVSESNTGSSQVYRETLWISSQNHFGASWAISCEIAKTSVVFGSCDPKKRLAHDQIHLFRECLKWAAFWANKKRSTTHDKNTIGLDQCYDAKKFGCLGS